MQDTINFINEQTNNFNPQIGVILGSGLGDIIEKLDVKYSLSYSDIPGFQKSTVQGHAGKLVFVEMNSKRYVFMQGRYHFYEGHSMQVVTYPIKVMKKIGVEKLVVTNAAGAVNKSFKPADLMIIKDHINLLGTNPLIGANDDSLGTRFPDMSEVYKKDLIELAKKCAKELKIKLQEGVYAACTGPSYETPTEVKMLRTLGADAVGMSTVPEAIVANYCGIKVLGISCLTNYAAGILKQPLSHQEVIDSANSAKEKFQSLLIKLLKEM